MSVKLIFLPDYLFGLRFMRPILAALISIFLIGGVYGYIQFAESVRRPPADVNIEYSDATYSIEIQRTFDCVVDEFFAPESLKVKFKGEVVFAKKENIAADAEIILDNLEGVEVGANEVYIEANRDEDALGLGVMKIVINRNDSPIAEKIITSEAGLSSVAGEFVFEIVNDETPESHAH